MTTYKRNSVPKRALGEKVSHDQQSKLIDTYDLVTGTITMKNFTQFGDVKKKDGSRWE